MGIAALPRLMLVAAVLIVTAAQFGGGHTKTGGSLPGTAAHYPLNPNFTEEAIYFSAFGLIRMKRHTLEAEWYVLQGVHTYDPVVTDDYIVVGSTEGVFALDAASGEILWQYASEGLVGTPTVSDGLVFVADLEGTISALDLATGDQAWRAEFDGWMFPPAVIGATLVSGGEDGQVQALDTRDGRFLWSHRLDSALVYRPVATTRWPVFITTQSGEAVALEQDGVVRWRREFDSPAKMAADEDRYYISQSDGRITAHDLASSDLLWEFQLEGPTSMPLRLIDGRVVGSSDSGQTVILDSETGVLLHESMPETAPDPFAPPPEEDEAPFHETPDVIALMR